MYLYTNYYQYILVHLLWNPLTFSYAHPGGGLLVNVWFDDVHEEFTFTVLEYERHQIPSQQFIWRVGIWQSYGFDGSEAKPDLLNDSGFIFLVVALFLAVKPTSHWW